jgi:hypothetical protein
MAVPAMVIYHGRDARATARNFSATARNSGIGGWHRAVGEFQMVGRRLDWNGLPFSIAMEF